MKENFKAKSFITVLESYFRTDSVAGTDGPVLINVMTPNYCFVVNLK